MAYSEILAVHTPCGIIMACSRVIISDVNGRIGVMNSNGRNGIVDTSGRAYQPYGTDLFNFINGYQS